MDGGSLKRVVHFQKGDLVFSMGKWVANTTDIKKTSDKCIAIRRLAGSETSDLEPDKTVRLSH